MEKSIGLLTIEADGESDVLELENPLSSQEISDADEIVIISGSITISP